MSRALHTLWEAVENIREHAVAQLVEALRYKPEGCGFDSQLDDSASNKCVPGIFPGGQRRGVG